MPYTVTAEIEGFAKSYTFAMTRESAHGDARTPFDLSNRTGLCGRFRARWSATWQMT